MIAVTARKQKKITYEWLDKNGLGYIVPYFIDLQPLNSIPDFDYLLDDSPKKIARLIDNTKKQAFIFESSQNINCVDILNRYVRVKDWEDFLSKVIG